MKVFASITILLLLTVIVLPANAAGLVPCGGPGESPCTLCHFFKLGQNIINFMTLQLALPLATIMIAVGGVILAISGSRPAWHTWGKDVLWRAIIGLVIVLASWIIINTVINLLAGTEQPTGFPWPWYEVQC